MPLTQDQIATQMVAQLRLLDPSISAEVGTPERKIIDTVAQQIAEAQVNINLVSGALDLSGKFGTDLDNFVGLFGFGRQSGAFATGFVTLARPTASPFNITIPATTQVAAQIVTSDDSGTTTLTQTIVFQTTVAVTLQTGQTSVIAPIQALIAGSQGNVAAGTITQFANVGAPVLGITSVTNQLPTTNGDDAESDAELKVRFRNTVFRNLAGTEDQYMALAVATLFSTKATVLGPISRYQEYMQIPTVDDGQIESPDGNANGVTGWWTTTPSNNPYAQYIYTNVPYFVTNGQTGAGAVFYRQDSDFVLNAPPLNSGDTFREALETPPDLPNPTSIPTRPNLTFFNVYTGTDETVMLPRPGDIVLLEYSYLSAESRNSITRNITNCVDVYVNGENPTTASAVIPPPTTATAFNNNPIDKFYYTNFRRIGEPDTPPTLGNIFSGLFWQPVIGLPASITVGGHTFNLGTDYWAVEDITLIGNTVRSRNGIEWTVGAVNTIATSGATSVTVTGYSYDQNIVTLQAALEGAKQVTTDVLAHRATERYFKLDLTIVYGPGVSVTGTNAAIETAISNFFDGQYFGSTIQLSDLLVTVRNVSGVQNVRWSNDVIHPSDDAANTLNRVTECDVNGNPRGASFSGTATNGFPTLTGVVVSAGVPAVGQLITASGFPVGTTIIDITGSTYTLSGNYTGTTGLISLTSTQAFNTDFSLRDSELPMLPVNTITGDTLPGLILRPRAQNVFNIV